MHSLIFFSILAFTISTHALPENSHHHPPPYSWNHDDVSVWQPKATTPYQMILTGAVDDSQGDIEPSKTPIFDVDLFYTNKSVIDALHDEGKKVICYFSAGSSEDWRPDYTSFAAADKGPCLNGWAGERYVDVRSANVFNVMKKRIALAAEKGCDGIDPDNMDGTGFGFTTTDTVNYIKKLAKEAHTYGIGMGLKNVQDLLSRVQDDVQFAVNEECGLSDGDCDAYTSFLKAGKPVFHVEYANYKIVNGQPIISSNDTALAGLSSDELRSKLCLKGVKSGGSFSTTIKSLNLDGWVLYCDGSWTSTKTVDDGVHKGKLDCPDGN
jgi:hypothetical protein